MHQLVLSLTAICAKSDHSFNGQIAHDVTNNTPCLDALCPVFTMLCRLILGIKHCGHHDGGPSCWVLEIIRS